MTSENKDKLDTSLSTDSSSSIEKEEKEEKEDVSNKNPTFAEIKKNRSTPSNIDDKISQPASKFNKKNLALLFFSLIVLITFMLSASVFKKEIHEKYLSLKSFYYDLSLNIRNEGNSERNPIENEVTPESISKLTDDTNQKSDQKSEFNLEPKTETKSEMSTPSIKSDLSSKGIMLDTPLINNVASDDTPELIDESKFFEAGEFTDKEKTKKEMFIKVLQDLSVKSSNLKFNSKKNEFNGQEIVEEQTGENDPVKRIISNLFSLIKVTRVENNESSLRTPDFYLIVREHLKLRFLAAKLIIASQLDVNPIHDLNEASLLLEKYFLRDEVFFEINDSLSNLIRLLNEKKIGEDGYGD